MIKEGIFCSVSLLLIHVISEYKILFDFSGQKNIAIIMQTAVLNYDYLQNIY